MLWVSTWEYFNYNREQISGIQEFQMNKRSWQNCYQGDFEPRKLGHAPRRIYCQYSLIMYKRFKARHFRGEEMRMVQKQQYRTRSKPPLSVQQEEVSGRMHSHTRKRPRSQCLRIVALLPQLQTELTNSGKQKVIT